MKNQIKKKKVALLTCFLNNYGACLQAHALQNCIEKLGYDCDIIPYIEPYGYEDFNINKITIFKMHIRSLLDDLRFAFKKKKPFNYNKKILSFYNFRKKFLKFELDKGTKNIKLYRSIEDFNNISNDYDFFVCGSDQIWNPTFYNKNNPAYFLTFVKDKKRIAYAPSIGLSEIPDKYREEFITYVNRFNSISTREQKGAEIIKKLCNRDAKVVLDPTLLAGKDFWFKLLKKRYSLPHKKYIFCYIFSNTPKCNEYLHMMQQQTGLPIVYTCISNLSYDNLNATLVEYAGPIDFLQLINHANFVVTDSFHGTAFSILLNKDFYVFKRERSDETIDMFSRINNILNEVGLENRAVSIEQPFHIKPSIDFEKVNSNLNEIRKDSLDYLKNSLLD